MTWEFRESGRRTAQVVEWSLRCSRPRCQSGGSSRPSRRSLWFRPAVRGREGVVGLWPTGRAGRPTRSPPPGEPAPWYSPVITPVCTLPEGSGRSNRTSSGRPARPSRRGTRVALPGRMFFEPVPSLADQLARKLRRDIFDGVWRAGQRLPSERELSRRLGVSRETVRLALHRLESEGLILPHARAVMRVADVDGAGLDSLPARIEYLLGRRDLAALHALMVELEALHRYILAETVALAAVRQTSADRDVLWRSLGNFEMGLPSGPGCGGAFGPAEGHRRRDRARGAQSRPRCRPEQP